MHMNNILGKLVLGRNKCLRGLMHALHRAQAPYEINPWNTSYQEARKNNGKIGITVIHVDKIDVVSIIY
jgi:hypothetical protein